MELEEESRTSNEMKIETYFHRIRLSNPRYSKKAEDIPMLIEIQ